MVNTLVQADDLAPYPGAPFTEDVVDAAVAHIRDQADWHIAPVVTETVTVDSWGGQQLHLPTKYLLSVTGVRDVTYGSNQALTGWFTHPTRLFRSGIVTIPWGWPYGVTLEFDIVHGYDSCPPDLLPVIAHVAADMGRNQSITRSNIGTMSVVYAQGGLANSVPDRYRLTGV